MPCFPTFTRPELNTTLCVYGKIVEVVLEVCFNNFTNFFFRQFFVIHIILKWINYLRGVLSLDCIKTTPGGCVYIF